MNDVPSCFVQLVSSLTSRILGHPVSSLPQAMASVQRRGRLFRTEKEVGSVIYALRVLCDIEEQ